ncbi:hypothetical protein Ssi03_52290 [Sphaerisporangium siamense]|uniref:Uncharacterized protein n=1 Tax=Sphaerisporangium siamense TaxID=795645 RepID=A0A7W7GAS2_9ACTN|nr:hypothetical protein [Sphaerisporangium siamense]MBB4702070.1 hypothetical protein [Sphaerisporangium siamense]GII87239.1 hypothetical protein Ssi03_52290 [Sphaerisporangium siamense]
MDPPYVGYISSRGFTPGADGVAAISDLGVLPSVLKATRLLVLWEERYLRVGFGMPVEAFESGVVVLDARFRGHTLHWRPFTATPATTPGRALHLQWGTPARYEDVELPGPVATLLGVWREFRDDDLTHTVIRLQEAGYEVNWVGHPD